MMLYRMRPHTPLDWFDLPGLKMSDFSDHGIDPDQLDWQPTEDRMFSNDLLRIAIRHGAPSRSGLLVDVNHTHDLGRADKLRISQHAIDELQAELRAAHGDLMERLMPGWEAQGEALDQRIRESTEESAREADETLAQVLAAPIQPQLADHWRSLGGVVPD